MKELKEIWKRNTFWQNMAWLGSIVALFSLLAYALCKGELTDKKDD